jgi:hypothetical protein
MRILIDECLNWRLGRALTGHYAISAQRMGWGGIKNGGLSSTLNLTTDYADFTDDQSRISFIRAIRVIRTTIHQSFVSAHEFFNHKERKERREKLRSFKPFCAL